jgi:lysyl-tRNA synthetase class 2
VSENKNLKEIINFRIEKFKKIKESEVESFPYSFKYSCKVIDLIKNQKEWMDKSFKICGRVVSIRKMGKASFVNIQDGQTKIQLYVKTSNLPDLVYDDIVRNLDIGDIIGINGSLFYTKTNELSVKVSDLILLSKNIRPLPNLKEKDGKTFFSYEDKELRYRNRHLDLITNPEIKIIFSIRSLVFKIVRNFLDERGYLEVETPILQPIYGGASAKPFSTFHNTLEQKLYLRIASELYLKRLIVGGIEKVYEIGKNFRNEGMDKNHNPEFTMLEFYESYSDLNDMMKLTESLFRQIAKNLNKDIFEFNNNKIDLSKKFESMTMKDLFVKHVGINVIDCKDDELRDICIKNDIDYKKYPHRGKVVEKVFSNLVEPRLIQPTFVTDYPVEISPLARYKRNDNTNTYVERFELFISGVEIANSFSELNDSFDQRERLIKQQKLADNGDSEAQVLDEDFIKVLETGMPPTGGVGIGLDRMVMIFSEQKSIKDVIFFPSMRSE